LLSVSVKLRKRPVGRKKIGFVESRRKKSVVAKMLPQKPLVNRRLKNVVSRKPANKLSVKPTQRQRLKDRPVKLVPKRCVTNSPEASPEVGTVLVIPVTPVRKAVLMA